MSRRSSCNIPFVLPHNLSGAMSMKVLDKNIFRTAFRVPALRIESKLCSLFLKQLQHNLLNRPRIKNVMLDSEEQKGKKVLLLNPSKKISDWPVKEKELVMNRGAEEIEFDLVLNYEHWTVEEILRAILPAEVTEIPSAFETIGHIAHVNLRDVHLPYKNIIGQVILDKNSPQIRTVVNKLNIIDTTFRFFKMEVLAGDSDLKTSVKEHGCVFEFDFSKVYWNSRLQTEHKRLVDKFTASDVVCDMFAGVGPFVIPAAKKGCLIYANDLNPESYKALCHNTKINHMENRIKTLNMDGREFVKKLVTDWSKMQDLGSGNTAAINENSKLFTQVIMNLPASAVEFLDVFRGFLTPFKDKFISSGSSDCTRKLPQIHCYCFSKAAEPTKDAKLQVEQVLGTVLPSECDCYYVRNVAPQKAMICVSFMLPESVAFCENNKESMKRPRKEGDTKNCKEIKLEKDDNY